jgi:hypothetical protein
MPALGFAERYPIYNNQPIEFWIRSLQTGQDAARANAAAVLGRFGPAARVAVGALVKALDDKTADVRQAAIDALGMIGPDAAESAPALAKFLGYTFDRFETDLAKHAAIALAKVQPNSGGPLIAALFDSGAFRPRTRTAVDVGRLERLNQALNPQDPEIKQVAVISGIGQLFAQAAWDPKLDKAAEAAEEKLKQIQDKPQGKDDAKKDDTKKDDAKKDEKKNGKKEEKKDENKDDAKASEVTPIGFAAAGALQDLKDYRDQIRVGPESLPYLVGDDREQWRNIVKMLAASADGLKVLGRVVADFPQSEMTGIILAEW